jgi:hypothetical protein
LFIFKLSHYLVIEILVVDAYHVFDSLKLSRTSTAGEATDDPESHHSFFGNRDYRVIDPFGASGALACVR